MSTRILHLSDLHFGARDGPVLVRALASLPERGQPDLVGASGGAGATSAQYGGSGAAGSNVNGVAAVGGAASSGGGGGAAGRIRFTTKSGQVAGAGTITPTLGSPGAKAFTATVH